MYSIFEWAANGQREYSVGDYTRAQLMPRTHVQNNRRSGCCSCNLYKIENQQLFNDALLLPICIHPWCRGEEGRGQQCNWYRETALWRISWNCTAGNTTHTLPKPQAFMLTDPVNTLNEGSLWKNVPKTKRPKAKCSYTTHHTRDDDFLSRMFFKGYTVKKG